MDMNPKNPIHYSQIRQITIHNLKIHNFFFHLNENQAQMMAWYGLKSICMITAVSSKKGSMRINMQYSVCR